MGRARDGQTDLERDKGGEREIKKIGKSDMRRLALSPLLVSMATGDIPARGRVFCSLSD